MKGILADNDSEGLLEDMHRRLSRHRPDLHSISGLPTSAMRANLSDYVAEDDSNGLLAYDLTKRSAHRPEPAITLPSK